MMGITAHFIIGGTVILVGAERLALWGSESARRFFLSPAWPVLRYALIVAALVMSTRVVTAGL